LYEEQTKQEGESTANSLGVESGFMSRELEIKIMSFNFHQLSLKFEQILSCQEHTGVSGEIRVGAHIRQSIETALQY